MQCWKGKKMYLHWIWTLGMEELSIIILNLMKGYYWTSSQKFNSLLDIAIRFKIYPIDPTLLKKIGEIIHDSKFFFCSYAFWSAVLILHFKMDLYSKIEMFHNFLHNVTPSAMPSTEISTRLSLLIFSLRFRIETVSSLVSFTSNTFPCHKTLSTAMMPPGRSNFKQSS